MRRWAIHGVTVDAEADDEFLASLQASGMECLVDASSSTPACCRVRAERASGSDDPQPGDWQLLRRADIAKGRLTTTAHIYIAKQRPDALRVDFDGHAIAEVDYAGNQIRLRVIDREFFTANYDPLYSASVLHKSLLLELLPTWGVVPLHAGMCALGDRGVIVCGAPGMGKSLALLALVAHGAAYMGDELGFLRRRADGVVELLDFPIYGKVKRAAAALLPQGLVPPNAVVATSDDVLVFNPGRLGVRHASNAPARLVINVVGCGEQATRVEPAAGFEALQALMMYDVFYGDRHASRQFELLADVTAQTDCLDVSLGPDLDTFATRIAEQVSSV